MRVLYDLMIRPGREPDVRKLAGNTSEDKFREWGLKGHFFFRGNAFFLYLESEGDEDPLDRLRREKGAKKLLDTLVKETSFDPDRPEDRLVPEFRFHGAREVTA